MSPRPKTFVTLNSFQGPSLGLHRSLVEQKGRAAMLLTQAAERAARWMLNHVQHDEIEREAGV